MFINKKKIYVLWGIIVGLLVIITVQAFGSHGFVMVENGGTVKKEKNGINNKASILKTVGEDVEKNNNDGGEKSGLGGKNIRICIQGAVKKPGTIILPEKARLEDAINGAGGFLETAATRYLNLAGFLEDGAFVYIQTKAEEKKNGTALPLNTNIMEGEATGAGTSGLKDSGIININKASVKELDSLPGIGAATAEKIIEYRKSKGAFKKIEELKNVSGIGDGKFEKLKERIKI